MVVKIAVINGVTTKTCSAQLFQLEDWEKKIGYNPYMTVEQNFEFYFKGFISTTYDKKIVDDLISSIGLISELTIKEGVIVGVKPIKRPGELLDEYRKREAVVDEL